MLLQRFAITIALFVAAASALGLDVAAPQPTDLTAEVTRVERDSDLDGALKLVEALKTRTVSNARPEDLMLLGRVALAAAEMRRYDYEKAVDIDPRDRRLLGRDIDDVAKIGHDALDALPDDNSEKWRIKADLYMTMIRSYYKGNKYIDAMDSAMAKALELDPKNPNALVTASKRPLFAEEQHGGDVPKAMDLLNRALEIDANMERAIAFRGVAYESLGETDKAIAEWKRALELNPKSRLAQDKLDAHKVAAK